MCFFRKKTEADTVKKNRDQISFNEKQIETLIVLAGGNEDYIKSLRATKEKIKYLTPSAVGKVADYDKKIKDLIDDLKIVLTKAAGEEIPQKANNLLTQINVYIAERNANI